MHSTHGSLAYLRSYGFRTFDSLWDESYDDIVDDAERVQALAKLLEQLDQMTIEQKQQLYLKSLPIIEHNYQHFYSGGFKNILWQELMSMLETLDTYRPAILDEEPQDD